MYDLEPKPKPKAGCLARMFKLAAWGIGILVVLFIVLALFSGNTQTKPTAPTMTDAELMSKAHEVGYTELARNTEQHTGEAVKMSGKVVQVMESSGNYTMRINVTNKGGFYDDTVLVLCQCKQRPLENDIVSFIGTVDGRTSYNTVLGATVTLPQISAQIFNVQ